MAPPQRDENNPEEESSARLVVRLLALAWRYRNRCLSVFFLQVVLLVLGISGLTIVGAALDVLRHALQHGAPDPRWPFWLRPPAGWTAFKVVGVLGSIVLVMAMIRAVLNYTLAVTSGKLIHVDLVPYLRATVYAKLQRLSFRFFDEYATGSIINRVTRDVQLLRSFVDGVLLQGAIMLLSLGGYLAWMLTTHIGLTAASLGLTPLMWLLTRLFSRWARPQYQQSRRLADEMIGTMAEGAEGAQVVKVFGREALEHDKFVQKNRAVLEQQQKLFRNVSRFTPALALLSQLNLATVLLYGGWLVSKRTLSYGELFVFLGLLQQFAMQVQNMATIVNTLQQSLSGARRVFEILDTPIEIQSRLDAERPQKLTGRVRFEHVDFAYSPQKANVLTNVDLEVEPGQFVAILGETGSGKSTLLSLIPRFYDVTRGRVLVDGTDVRDLDVDTLRRHIGLVFQESLLFSTSVAQNIAFGHPEANQEQIERAARIAGAHDFIMALPEGYETRLQAGATNLSGGQRQRLAIARAVMLEPTILLLDDPTASVDPDTEREVLAAMDSATQGRTTFVIANRLSTLRRADLIVVLQGGRIVQTGRHAELIRQSGLYRRTAELQSVDSQSLRVLGLAEGAQ
jgi:ATP-binding cassette subfamily B protein